MEVAAATTTPPPDDPPDKSWILGCMIYLCGSVVINLGHTLIRLSHVKSQRGPGVWATVLWLAGFGLFASGDVVNLAGLNLAAQSLLEALGSVQFISNLFFSVYLLGESLKRRHVASTLLIVVGNVLIVAWGDHQRQKITLTLVLKLVASPPFLVYMSVVYSLAIAIGTAEYCSRSKKGAQGNAGLGALSYALSSAMVGANSVMVIKALMGLVDTYLANKSPDQKPPTQRVVVSLILIALLALLHISFWITRLNSALKRYPALYIVPVLQACWISFTVLSGGIFFQEFSSLSPAQCLGFASGLLVVICGVLLLVPRQDSTADLGGNCAGGDGGGGVDVADRGFERGFLQARAMLDAGELDEESFDDMFAILARSWKSQRLRLDGGRSRARQVGGRVEIYRESNNSSGSGCCMALFESVQEWLDVCITEGKEGARSHGVGADREGHDGYAGGGEVAETIGSDDGADSPCLPLIHSVSER